MKHNELKNSIKKPSYAITITAMGIFVIELLIMLLFPELSNRRNDELLDALSLVLLLSPILHFLIYKPMSAYLAAKELAEKELVSLNKTLEVKVSERTAELERMYLLTKTEFAETLKLSEERYKSVVESLRVGIIVLNHDLEILTTNGQITLWYPQADFSEKPKCYSIFNHEAKASICKYCPAQRTFVDGQVHQMERTFEMNGATRGIRITTSPIRDKDGNVVAVTEVMEDITGYLEAQEANEHVKENLERLVAERTIKLSNTENKYHRLLMQSCEGVAIIDVVTGKVLEANKRFMSMLGYSEMEIINLCTFDLIAGSGQEFNTLLGQLLEGSNRDNLELECKKKDGTFVPVEVSNSLISLDNTDVCLVSVRDITERKRAEEELNNSLRNLKLTLEETVNALITVTEKRDPYTAGHQVHVASLAELIGKELGLVQSQIDGIRIAAKLHDIGKIYVPIDILNKPGRLSEMEMAIIRTHPQVGYEILRKIPFEAPVAQIVMQHHERLDGSGYPQGLAGEDILFEARILSVADVVEAMVSHRPYRPAIGLEKAVEEITRHKARMYDPRVVEACLRVLDNQQFSLGNIPVNGASVINLG